jgi:hypothetical protein
VQVFQSCVSSPVVHHDGTVGEISRPTVLLRASDSGLQLGGLIELFGGVWPAGNAFEDPFWRALLTELAGRPDDIQKRQIGAVERALAEAVEAAGGTLRPNDVPKAAEEIAKRAWRRAPELRAVQAKTLKSRFAKFASDLKGRGGHWKFPEGRRFDERARSELNDLVERGVLLQGTEARCPNCRTTSWIHVDELRRDLVCPGCLAIFALPFAPDWMLRANELVAGAIRGGVLPVLNALYQYASRAAVTLTYAVSQDVFRADADEKLTDVDVLVLKDGELHIGEVKSHPAGFDEKAINGIVEIARLMRADVLLFAAEGGPWPEEVRARIEVARKELAALGTRVMAGSIPM